MDDPETLRRRARLRELVKKCFDDKLIGLLTHIKERTGKEANQGELSGLQKDNGERSFGDKKARTLTEQIGLQRQWFAMDLGENLDRSQWLLPSKLDTSPSIVPKNAISNAFSQKNDPWPFPDIDQARFSNLLPRQQIEIQGLVRERLEKFEEINQRRKHG